MNRFAKRVLILAIFVLCLFGLTILGASAATYADDTTAVAENMVARIGDEGSSAVYYATVEEAIAAATGEANTVVIINDCSLTTVVKSLPCDVVLTSKSADVTVTVAVNHWYDLSASAVGNYLTVRDVNFACGSNAFAWLNGDKLVVEDGAKFVSATDKYVIHTEGESVLSITGGYFEHSGSGSIIDSKAAVSVTGGTFVHNGSGIVFKNQDGKAFKVEGEGVSVVSKGNSYVFYEGWGASITGAYVYTEAPRFCTEAGNDYGYLKLIDVACDNDDVATLFDAIVRVGNDTRTVTIGNETKTVRCGYRNQDVSDVAGYPVTVVLNYTAAFENKAKTLTAYYATFADALESVSVGSEIRDGNSTTCVIVYVENKAITFYTDEIASVAAYASANGAPVRVTLSNGSSVFTSDLETALEKVDGKSVIYLAGATDASYKTKICGSVVNSLTIYGEDAIIDEIVASCGLPVRVALPNGVVYTATLEIALGEVSEGAKIYNKGANDESDDYEVTINGFVIVIYSNEAINVDDLKEENTVVIYNDKPYTSLELADAAARADGMVCRVHVDNKKPIYYNNVVVAFAAAQNGASIYSLGGTALSVEVTVGENTVTYYAKNDAAVEATYVELGMIARVGDMYFDTIEAACLAANGEPVKLIVDRNTADAEAAAAGMVVRLGSGKGAMYYATFEDGISAIAKGNNVLCLIASTTTARTISGKTEDAYNVKVACSFTLTSIDPENIVLTVGTSWLFDLGGGSTVEPTIENIKIDVATKNLGYFNNVKVVINAGTTITGVGNSYGLIHCENGKDVVIATGVTFIPTGANQVFNMKGDSAVTLNNCEFKTGYWAYGEGKASLTVNGGTFTMNGSGASLRGFFMYGAETTFVMTDAIITATRADANNIIRADGKATISGGSMTLYTANGALGNNPIRLAGIATIENFELSSNYTGGTLYITTGANVTIQSGTYVASKGTLFLMDGGKLTINNGSFSSASGPSALVDAKGDETTEVKILAGRFENDGQTVLHVAGSVSMEVRGGTFVLQPSPKTVGSTPTSAVVRIAGTSTVKIFGGVFVNNNDTPSISDAGYPQAVILKNSADATAVIRGGTFLANRYQDYYYKTVGDSATVNSIPYVSIPILKNADHKMNFGGNSFYYLAYNEGVEFDLTIEADVQLYLDIDSTDNSFVPGIMFASSISADAYAMLQTWLANVNTENEGTYKLQFGTLIAKMSDVTEVGQFTIEAFKATFGANTQKYLDIPATKATQEQSGGMKSDTQGNWVIRAAMINLTPENYSEVFTATPYVRIVNEADANDVLDTYYGAFSSTKAANSLASLVKAALADNSAVKDAPAGYEYYSVTVAKAFNRYTGAQQNELMNKYLPKEHTLNYKGECVDTDCALCVRENLTVDAQTSAKVYTDYESAHYYAVNLVAGVSYNIQLSKNIGICRLYNADGTLCELNNGVFNCAADGTYYLVVYATQIGSADLSVNHVHKSANEADSFKGYCDVCEKSFLVSLAVDQPLENLTIVKGENYYYKVTLTADINYVILAVNATYVLYNADGERCQVKNSVFECVEDGDYYIVATASISAKASMKVEHTHAYDHTGVCIVSGCDADVSETINGIFKENGNVIKTKFLADSVYYYNAVLEAGNLYTIHAEPYVGQFKIYNAAGQPITLSNANTFECPEDGTYYIVLTVEQEQNAEIYLSYEHDCEYTFMGKCAICGVSIATVITQDRVIEPVEFGSNKVYYFEVKGPYSPTTYKFALPIGLASVVVYDANNTELAITAEGEVVITESTEGSLYLVIESGEDIVYGNITVSHDHVYNHMGKCTIGTCTNEVVKALNIGADKAEVLSFQAAGEVAYYRVYLAANANYTITVENATWVLYNESDEALFEDGTITSGSTDEYYYLVVTATAAAGEGATIAIVQEVASPAE